MFKIFQKNQLNCHSCVGRNPELIRANMDSCFRRNDTICLYENDRVEYLVFLFIFSIGFIFFISSECLAFVNVNLDVEGCNNNNICEPPNETNINCPNDCTSCNNNNVCEVLKGETTVSCSSDCITSSIGNSGGSGGSVATQGEILSLNIKTGINYAIISWNTSVPTYGSVSWGIGDSYNGGVINGIKITAHHEVIIENLSASTTYSYFINSSLQQYYYAKNIGSFTTLPVPIIKIIPSINNFTATSTNNEIILNWKNPSSNDFYGVKIVRSPFFYPTDPFEGRIVYDGNGTYARDSDVVKDNKYYYSAFSYDKDLKYSSGVVVEGILKSGQSTDTENGASGDLESKNIETLPVNDLVFIQKDLELSESSSTILVYPFNDIKIVIDVDRLPTDTKTLIFEIQDPSNPNKRFTYSFSLDSSKRFFYIVIPNLEDEDVYPFIITAYGSNNKEIAVVKGFLNVKSVKKQEGWSFFNTKETKKVGEIENIEYSPILDMVMYAIFDRTWDICALIIILIIYFLYRHKYKNKDRKIHKPIK